MDPRDLEPGPATCLRSVAGALGRIALGLALIGLAAHLAAPPLAAGWCGMLGLVLVLHFGTFDLVAAAWQKRGCRARPIMKAPLRALTLSDFWGRRWNSGFRDLAHPFIFAPLAHRWGSNVGHWASFLISGLVHELVISVPAGAGYGWPTLYFLLQAWGISRERRRGRANAAPAWRWLATHAFTGPPAFLLFHPPFVEGVILPFIRLAGTLP